MAFPDEPLGGSLPPGETEQHTYEVHDPFPDEAGHYESPSHHVSGEVMTDAAQTHLDETHSYSDRPESNERITSARQKLAHVVMNGDQKYARTARSTRALHFR